MKKKKIILKKNYLKNWINLKANMISSKNWISLNN